MPRPRSFDEGDLLDAAIELFWANGYQAVSLTEISEVTGVGNGSLYQAFGSKWSLFLAAFRRYCARRAVTVADAVAGDRGDVGDLVDRYFAAIIRDCAEHPDRRGCLMLNAIAELGASEDVASIAAETVETMNAHVGRALAEATGRDEDDEAVRRSAAHVVSLSQAMIHLSRVGPSTVDLHSVGHQAAVATRMTLERAA